MAVRKTGRTEKAAGRNSESSRRINLLSAVAGGLLICVALACFGWLIASQHNAGLTFRFPFTGSQSQPTAQPTVDPLLAAGITLATPGSGQTALLNRQQALLLANQMEPQAAVHASSVNAAYILFSYKGSTTTTGALNSVPAWLVHYSKVVLAAPDNAADPHATNTPHECYLFLDANSGQELLALWT
ncbi:MAG TPA: hypothetical protein VGD98_01535 [Ktedonobacteraceae bacterium]